ncbi:TIGR03621 family F420-dependent LLM class oxidoreductase [Aeromicrobium sp. 9AM]|uniref:TIGR03621 family F420-dependent LLM class oxidoreductase n=1 Tax=Aeromicrobium sp. 9AM TaxID=2653126 RepID=UPI0012F320D0|nr:TIGR03621 family F420-dependent LLM class oxidoreductase [Aeromicrobium sp. 9AM]VXB74045.1 conserved hypothetical protein [Aeromicrobium sp. 9AM]
MAEPRKIRIGVEMMEPFEGLTWAETARDLEDSGFSTMFAPDHLDEGFGPITAMATAAAATTSLHVATAVFAADFRHPAVLARELASIDLLSQGRLEVGIGAGYQVNDYNSSGVTMNVPKVRVDRMIEHVKVLKGLFGDEPFSFAGEHYTINELNGTPKPFTPGGPPIFVAGGGKRMLRFAARHANIIGVNPALSSSLDRAQSLPDALPNAIDEKFTWIRDAAGERFDQIEFHAWLKVAKVTADAHTEAEKLTGQYGTTTDEILASPVILIGSVDEILERLHERRERWGYSYYTIQQPAVDEFREVVRRLA